MLALPEVFVYKRGIPAAFALRCSPIPPAFRKYTRSNKRAGACPKALRYICHYITYRASNVCTKTKALIG